VARLEDRTLLSGPSGDVLAAVAIPIALGTPKTGTLSANEVVFFQISPTTDGRLIAQLHAPGGTTRLTLMDSQVQVLLTSDGQSPTNQDDQLELYVSAGTDFLEVQNLGGSGTYSLTTSLRPSAPPLQPIPINPDGSGPEALVTGDFNGDGRTDLAVANSGAVNSGDNDVSILLGNGDGTFQNQVTYAVGSYPVALVTGDFNGDGRTDLAVANSGSNDVSILLGNGNGTFKNPVTYAVGSYPVALVTDDFTGDGHVDLAVAGGGVSVLLGNGDGTFQPQVTYAVGLDPDAIVAGDFTGDGRTDLAVANEYNTVDDLGNVSVLLGNGDGTFTAAGQFATTPHATPLVADVNGDGTEDVLVINGAGDIFYRQSVPGQPGTFEPPVTVNPGNPSRDIAWVPNTDQGPVLASVDAHDNKISLYAYRDGGFVLVSQWNTGFLPAQIITADLNGDGLTDLVVRNAGDVTLSVFFDTEFVGPINPKFVTPQFSPPVTIPVGLGVSDVEVVDTTGSGRLDLVVTNKLTGQVSILQNLNLDRIERRRNDAGRPGRPSSPSRAQVVVASLPQGSLTTSTRGASRRKPSQAARYPRPEGIDWVGWGGRGAHIDITDGRRRRDNRRRARATNSPCRLGAAGRFDTSREDQRPRRNVGECERARILEHRRGPYATTRQEVG